MQEKPVINVGGSVEQALSGGYKIDSKAVMQEAWTLTKGTRSSINLGILVTLGIGMLVSLIVSHFLGGIEHVLKEPNLQAMLNIVVTLVVYPFLVGVEMLGVYHAIGVKTKTSVMFNFLKRGSWVAVCALMTTTLVTIGMQLFIIPGLFLLVSFSLVLPLVAEKGLSPLKAIVISVQALRHQWFQIFFVFLALFMVFVFSLMPLAAMKDSEFAILAVVFFLFCTAYLIPMFYHTKGILYREIFGMQVQVVDGGEPPASNTFSA